MRWRIIAVVAGAWAVIGGASASAAAKVRHAAVLDFAPQGRATAEQGMDVADNVRLMFYGSEAFELEKYRRIINAVTAARDAGLDLTAPKDVARAGKALNDDVVVTGAVAYDGTLYRVDVALNDVKGARVESSFNAEGPDLRLVTEELIGAMSGAEKFGVLFPDELRDLPASGEKELRWEISLIASPEELALYDLLSPRGKSMMLDKFWLRRDPDPNTPANEFEEEFGKRVGYAQSRFATPLTPGVRTDRGRVYVLYGPPDEVEDRSGGVGSIVGFDETSWSTKPYFAWKYYGSRDVHGRQMVFVFVDEHSDGEYLIFASTEPGYGKRIGTFTEYDANRLQMDAEDTGEATETTFWDPGASGNDMGGK